VPFYANNNV